MWITTGSDFRIIQCLCITTSLHSSLWHICIIYIFYFMVVLNCYEEKKKESPTGSRFVCVRHTL